MPRCFVLAGFLVWISSTPACGDVMRVPTDFPTIQSALDALSPGDTVLVDIGEYAEALTAPAMRFTLLGNVVVDTGDFTRPVVDASLQDSIDRGCLTLPPGSAGMIDRMRFRNRFGMSHRTDVGGVNCLANWMGVRHCAFDSLYTGIGLPNDLTSVLQVENCLFQMDSVAGINAQSAAVEASRCEFVGGWGWARLRGGAHSRITECSFREATLYLLTTAGEDVIVSNCTFGPSGPHTFVPVELVEGSGTIRDCVFRDIELGPYAGLVECTPGDTFRILDNLFIGISVTSAQGRSGFSSQSSNEPATSYTLFERNVFLSCTTDFPPKSIAIYNAVRMDRNHVADNGPPIRTAIQTFFSGSFVGRQNIFVGNGNALVNSGTAEIDARFNWWGDSTGPYHPQLNPDGLGDQVGNNILFEPWTRDTLEWLESETDLPEIPQRFDLSVYPNPFNATATIRIRVPEPEILKVELFDLLGRKVDDVWSGAVAIEKTIRLDTQEFPSGIYFVRTTEAIYNRPRATVKLALVK